MNDLPRCELERRSSHHKGIFFEVPSYLWSEILDADGFEAFEESGDIFDPAIAQKLQDYVYAAGYSRDPEAAYTAFRGRMAKPDALLRKRGLAEPPRRDA